MVLSNSALLASTFSRTVRSLRLIAIFMYFQNLGSVTMQPGTIAEVTAGELDEMLDEMLEGMLEGIALNAS